MAKLVVGKSFSSIKRDEGLDPGHRFPVSGGLLEQFIEASEDPQNVSSDATEVVAHQTESIDIDRHGHRLPS